MCSFSGKMSDVQPLFQALKISPKLSIFTPKFSKFPGGACLQVPLESEAAYFAPPPA